MHRHTHFSHFESHSHAHRTRQPYPSTPLRALSSTLWSRLNLCGLPSPPACASNSSTSSSSNSFKTIDRRRANVHITGKGCMILRYVSNIIIHGVHVHHYMPSKNTDIRSSPPHTRNGVRNRTTAESTTEMTEGASPVHVDSLFSTGIQADISTCQCSHAEFGKWESWMA